MNIEDVFTGDTDSIGFTVKINGTFISDIGLHKIPHLLSAGYEVVSIETQEYYEHQESEHAKEVLAALNGEMK